jgi:hypothetical protein
MKLEDLAIRWNKVGNIRKNARSGFRFMIEQLAASANRHIEGRV